MPDGNRLKQRGEVSQKLARYQNGLQKLSETEQIVAGLQQVLAILLALKAPRVPAGGLR